MDLGFYARLLLRRLHYIILLTILGTVLGVTIALILPPRYVSEALLVVESQQIPDELASSTVRTEAIEQLQIIRQRILARDRLLDMANRFDLYTAAEDEALSPDDIVTDMRARISIETSGGGGPRAEPQATLVNVSFSASDAQRSALVANEIVSQILQANVEMRTTVSGQTLDFFQQEVDRLDQELAERSARVAQFQEDNRDALPESLEFRRNQLISQQERVAEIDRELEQLRDRKRSLETLYAETGSIGLQQSEAEMTPEARRLQGLREEYAANAAVMSDQNPRMQILTQRIDALEEVVAAQSGAATDGEASAEGEATSAFDVQIADIDNQIEFLEERRSELGTSMGELQRTIQATPNNAITLSGLERDLENVRQQYDRAVESRARAETGDTIEALSKGQRISVIENAIAPDAPNSPNRRVVAIAGFGGGLMAGLGLVLLLELLNTTVRRSSEIQQALDITPIATLSYMRTEEEIRRRRVLIAGAVIVAAAVIPAGLWAIDTYYQPLDLIVGNILNRLPDIPALTGSTSTGAS
ncbi:lipopolysaccharide biosynthesis protein [Roseivivax halodurans JCM 10272]|uniref:Lipopolysaccharide biosynthesis protein n=1 Tax=Roseivivax halodurans JCM 10272 TaxID=1449350 RepID=X7EDL7_9RHOB|nr:Wzz/FepE/Etk N-terminal domain-containing protein [Roseivivax halodurans]ETX13223.1 lipopolysaccharide biosynthesis protein [Roseivivax halodurans JCM 10272]